jgi:hypothetical protein
VSADADILALLDASSTLTVVAEGKTGGINSVYQGFPAVDTTAKVVTLALPYLVFITSPGYDRDERYSGDVNGRVLDFQLTGVGQSMAQAKFVLDEARKVLNRKRLDGSLIKRSPDNALVRRDDDYTRSGGLPIFFGVDRYSVAV